MDWAQLAEIASAPDNIPIVALLFLIPFFTWYGFRQALATDRLITRLEGDSKLAKTHHRKIEPYREGWDQKLYVWPYLLRIEFLSAIICTFILMVWSITWAISTNEMPLFRNAFTAISLAAFKIAGKVPPPLRAS